MGTPNKYQNVDTKKLKMLYEAGHTDAFVAKIMDVSVQSILGWKRKYPEFAAKVATWKLHADEKVEKALFDRAVGYSCPETKVLTHKLGGVQEVTVEKHYPPDTNACKLWLINRQPEVWRDRVAVEGKVDHEHTGEVKHTVQKVDLEERIDQLTGGRLNALMQ